MYQNLNKRILFITFSRSEYGLLSPLIKSLIQNKIGIVKIFAGGTHFSKKFGNTSQEILLDGLKIDYKLSKSINKDSQLSWSDISSLIIKDVSKAINKFKPNLVIYMGDRIELLPIATACTIFDIPTCHISGGEITEGAIDDNIRHAITKLSSFHLVSALQFSKRLQKMGEENWRICISGEPGLCRTFDKKPRNISVFSRDLKINLKIPTILFTFHPVTREISQLKSQLIEIERAINHLKNYQFLITYPCADPGSERIIKWIKKLQNQNSNIFVVKSLGRLKFFEALKYCYIFMTNSSAGIVESALTNIPVVNIGNRQKGRPINKNTISVKCNKSEILKGVNFCKKYDRKVKIRNIYGDGRSVIKSTKFIKKIINLPKDKQLNKKFVDV